MIFRKRVLMDEAVAAEGTLGVGGGGVAPAAGTETAAPEFTAELAFNSTSKTNEEAEVEAAATALANEAQGWIDPAKGSVSYEKTGDAALDVALGFLAKAGYSHHHPAVQAAGKGDFSLLAAELAAKGIAGWEQHLNLGKEAYARGMEQAKAQNEKIKSICLTHTNGDEALWGDTLSHWSQNADPEEKAVINKALASGDIVSEAVAHYMVHLYRNASGVTINPSKGVLANGASTQSAAAATPLSPLEYGKEVQKLASRIGGSNLNGSREYAQLQQRRAAYRG